MNEEKSIQTNLMGQKYRRSDSRDLKGFPGFGEEPNVAGVGAFSNSLIPTKF